MPNNQTTIDFSTGESEEKYIQVQDILKHGGAVSVWKGKELLTPSSIGTRKQFRRVMRKYKAVRPQLRVEVHIACG
jgi:spermidine synthase